MKSPVFTGACTALVTPFDNNEINLKVFDELIERQLEARIDALVICGTTAEAAVLSDEERLLLISHAVHYINGRCKIIAGCGSNDTQHAVHLAKLAGSLGADAILSVTPYYNKTTPEGLIKHYEAISEAVSIPIILYNVPSRTGMTITFDTYRKLDKLKMINGVKEASADVASVARILSETELNVWSGSDELIVPMMAIGAKGSVSTFGNVVPKAFKQMCDACMIGNFTDAAKLQGQYLKLIDLIFSSTNPLPLKAILNQMGLDVGDCRMPLYLSEEEKQKIMQRAADLLPEN